MTQEQEKNAVAYASELTQETADLNDWRVNNKRLKRLRDTAKEWVKFNGGYFCGTVRGAMGMTGECATPEGCDFNDNTEYLWAIVVEFDIHKKADIQLRRVADTKQGVILFEKRSTIVPKSLSLRKKMAIRRAQKTAVSEIRIFRDRIENQRKGLNRAIEADDMPRAKAHTAELVEIAKEFIEAMEGLQGIL